MTHIIVMSEGFKEGVENFFEKLGESCVYEQDKIADGETKKVGIDVREIRFWDIVVKETVKKEFLSNLLFHAPWSKAEVEKVHKSSKDGSLVAHGVDGLGFKIGKLRRIMQWALKLINARPVDLKNIEPAPNDRLLEATKEFPIHGHLMIIGELPDGIARDGREES